MNIHKGPRGRDVGPPPPPQLTSEEIAEDEAVAAARAARRRAESAELHARKFGDSHPSQSSVGRIGYGADYQLNVGVEPRFHGDPSRTRSKPKGDRPGGSGSKRPQRGGGHRNVGI